MFKCGDYVLVDGTKRGFIEQIHEQPNVSFCVFYVIENVRDKQVTPDRCTLISLHDGTSMRSGFLRGYRSPPCPSTTSINQDKIITSNYCQSKHLKEVLLKSRNHDDHVSIHPLVSFLDQHQNNNTRGWIRNHFPANILDESMSKKQLSASEKQILTTMYSLLLGNSSTSGKT